MKATLLLLAIVALAINAWMSWLVVRAMIFTTRQKFVYVLLVWIVPVCGAYFAWSVLNDEALQFRRASSEEDFMDIADANNFMTHHDSSQH